MKKAAFILLGLAAGLILIPTAYAKIDVEISNNGEGGKSSVNINNSVKINGQSTSSTDSRTHVRITTNGETKEYTSDGNEDVNIQSSDGTSKVRINNNSSQNNATGDTEKDEIKKDTDAAKKKIKEKIAKAREEAERDDERQFSDFFKDKWSFFSNILFFWRD